MKGTAIRVKFLEKILDSKFLQMHWNVFLNRHLFMHSGLFNRVFDKPAIVKHWKDLYRKISEYLDI